MRLDKFLVECGIGSRREVKILIKDKKITINKVTAKTVKDNVDPEKDVIEYNGNVVKYKEFRYYIMNKKAGYITATEDSRDKTVMDLLPEWVNKKDLAPVGRLDKDTEGLLLLTNDGKLNHKLLSPKSHVDKTYYVELSNNISDKDMGMLEAGVDIGGYVTMPAKAEKIEDKKIFLTIKEGKFHQVKKMLEAVNNKVVYLKRVSFGNLVLGDMEPGEVREIDLVVITQTKR